MRNAEWVHSGTTRSRQGGRRRPVLRWVIIALLLAALIEPLIMYRSLMRERAERRAPAEITLQGALSTEDAAR
jgi:hypothetical protein